MRRALAVQSRQGHTIMQASTLRASARAGPSSCRPQAGTRWAAAAPVPFVGRRTQQLCRAGDGSTDGEDKPQRDALSDDEMKKIAALQQQRAEQQQQAAAAQVPSSSNILQGALEEAQLITWPRPQKAFLDTLLVLAIVIGSGSLLFGVNVVLANASEWWYHQ